MQLASHGCDHSQANTQFLSEVESWCPREVKKETSWRVETGNHSVITFGHVLKDERIFLSSFNWLFSCLQMLFYSTKSKTPFNKQKSWNQTVTQQLIIKVVKDWFKINWPIVCSVSILDSIMFLLDKSSASQTKLKKQRSNIIIRSDVLQSNTSVRTVLPGSGHPSSVWCGTAGVSLVFHLKAFNSTITFIIIITTSIVSSLVA